MNPGLGIEIDIAVDAAQIPGVLIFQIASVAPTVHLDRQGVFTVFQEWSQIKFGRCHAALAVADALSVNPNIKGRLHPIEMNKGLPAAPLFRKGKQTAI